MAGLLSTLLLSVGLGSAAPQLAPPTISAPPAPSSLAESVAAPTPSPGVFSAPHLAVPYFGARYYGSKIGRFTTVDPYLDQSAALVDPQRWNRYAYVSNNPLRYVDPDGREQAVIVGDKTYMGGVDGMSAGNEQARDQVFNVLVTTVGVVAAAGSGFAAGGARQAAKEVLQEAVENVTGLPLGGLRGSPKGMSKTATGMADDLSGRIGKNSVPFETPSTKGHIDLRGKAHFDKATGQEIPTPHVQTRPKHVGPQGQVNLGPQTTRPATKADIRTAEKLVERRKP